MDDDKKAEVEGQDDKSSVVIAEADKQSSPKKREVTDEELETLANKRASDILAKKGDKAKSLEDRVLSLETENKTLKDARLSDVATKYGIPVEKMKEIGIDDPNRIETLAQLFGGKKSDEQSKITSTPDPGDISGSGTGKKPTYEELHDSDPFETEKKVKSGEWEL